MSSAVVCPHCKKRTTVGPDISRNRKWIFFGYSLVLLSIGLTITISTYLCRFRTDGVYSVQVGLLFSSLVMFAKAYQYHLMSVSHVIISGYEV
ncbi:hypothetical protein FGIG_06519 [Fasciola gigantica]|uniref:Phosphatidylinositol-4,5-bisphosphate 4-phosphatase n=1 Tax=Fasciola gigantica TaxID=46835 RepID=A0A504YER1_FASGI|nr:hypothetical protein FGIG_06519 [Fasciola gigantica]